MKHPVVRYSVKGGRFDPGVMRETINIPIAEDNLVCAHCGAMLGAVSWTIVSSAQHKGLIAFACAEHVTQAMNLIAAAFGAEGVSGDVKLPEPGEN